MVERGAAVHEVVTDITIVQIQLTGRRRECVAVLSHSQGDDSSVGSRDRRYQTPRFIRGHECVGVHARHRERVACRFDGDDGVEQVLLEHRVNDDR